MTTTEEKEFLMLLEAEEINLARNNFWQFCVYMDSEFFTDGKWHLKIIAKELQNIHDGFIKKLAISLPPRGGKSYLISMYCAWEIGLDEGKDSTMRNSYAADLADKFSYDVRDIIQKDKFLNVFPNIKLRNDKKALQGWATTKARDLTYFCAGVGGPITGKGCRKIAILDDPLKNVEEALSPTILDNVWNWYTSTHLSRMESGCAEIQIATRWSKNDVIGRLTDPESEFYSSDWTVIVVPALIDGKSFCEEIKTTKEYMEIKNVTEDFIWEAEYMQNPIEVKGLLFPSIELKRFKLKDLKRNDDGILSDAVIGYTDPADQGMDYTVSLVGHRIGDLTYITDVLCTLDGVEVTIPQVSGLIRETRCQMMKIESNAGGKLYADNVRKLVKDTFCSVTFEPNMQNKETRILMSAMYIKEYFVFREDYEPGSDYDRYMRMFTSYVKMGRNKNDDAPDATTGLAMSMQRFRKKEEKPLDTRLTKNGKYLRNELLMKGFKKSEIKKLVKQGIVEVIGE